METLPEEVLAEVMAMVVPDSADIKQVCDLLAMRLVCRRWSEVMLSPVLWSRRRIRMPERFSVYGREHRKCLALLRLAPALRSLELNISDTTVGRLVSKALSDGECRIKSLKIVFGRFNISLSKLFNKVLTMRQDTIEELYLDVHIVNSSVDSLVVAPLLSAVEDLKRLKRLTLGTLVKVKGCNCGFHTPSITYKFEGLGALEHVTFLPRLSRDLVISVLNCSKGNLLTAKWQRGNYSHGLGYCPVPQKLYRCEQLRELTLKYEDIDLIDVHRLSRLQKITFQDIFTSVLDVGRTLDIRRSASTLPELKTVELFTEYKPNSHDLKQLEQLLALHPDLNITVSQKSTKL